MKREFMKPFLILSVVFSMAAFAACGGSSGGAAETKAAAGTEAAGAATGTQAAGETAAPAEEAGGIEGNYIPVVGEMFGVALVGEELDGFTLELQKGGKGKMAVDGSPGNAKWKDNGDGTLTITVDGKDMTAETGKDILIFHDMMGMGIDLTFAKEGTDAADPALYLPESDKFLLGDWQSVSVVDIIGDPVDPSEMTHDALKMTFKGDHTLDAVISGTELKGLKWSNMGDYGSVDEEDQNISWNIEANSLSVDFRYNDEFYTFSCLKDGAVEEALKSGAAKPAEDADTAAEGDTEADAETEPDAGAAAQAGAAAVPVFTETSTTSSYGPYWNHNWYGWYLVESCSGEYEELEDHWWDVCGYIAVNDDDTGKVYLWDEDGDSDDPICVVDVSFREGTTEAGCMCSESGSFWSASTNIEHADWLVDPGASPTANYDNMIWIEGSYEDEHGDLRYNFYLRPWGTDWDDVRADFEDMLPASYDSWYVKVKDGPMPGKIGV